jgi:hypothetical protein
MIYYYMKVLIRLTNIGISLNVQIYKLLAYPVVAMLT